MNYAFVNVTNSIYLDLCFFFQLASTTETSESGKKSAKALKEEKVCR